MPVLAENFGLQGFTFPSPGVVPPAVEVYVVVPGPPRRMAYYRPYPVRRLVPMGIASVTVVQNVIVNHPRVVR